MHEDIIFKDGEDDEDLEAVIITRNKYTEIYNNIKSIIYCPTDLSLECENANITHNNDNKIFSTSDITINITNETIIFTCDENYIEGQLFYILNSTHDNTNLVKMKLYIQLNLISQYNDTMIKFSNNSAIIDYDIFIYLENILVLKKKVNESGIMILSTKDSSDIMNFDLGWNNAFLLFHKNRFTYAVVIFSCPIGNGTFNQTSDYHKVYLGHLLLKNK
ncbi:hypothetical protein HZS_1169 [Henneguya salminicola]|nr:hypothetical protein HZS_1169 [Henneguya salminicola]